MATKYLFGLFAWFAGLAFCFGAFTSLSAYASDAASASATVGAPTRLSAAKTLQKEIRVRAETELDSQKYISLGDVVEFVGFDKDDIEEMSVIRLGDAPLAGESRYFTHVAMSEILRDHVTKFQNDANERVQMRIPSKMIVRRRTFRLSEKEVSQALLEHFKTFCADCEFELAQLSLPLLNQDIPPGSSWKINPRAELPKGSFSIPIEIRYDDGTKRLYWIAGSIIVRKVVPVAKRQFAPGDKIQEEDVVNEKREITFFSDVVLDMKELKTSVASRSIAPNQILGRSLIRREAAIRGGEQIRIVSGSETWQISIEGVAQQSGFVGDMVKVKIPRTQKVLSALVLEKGLVEVR